MKPKATELFSQAYGNARTLATIETGLPKETFPVEPPFSLEQALDPEFWPGRSLDDRG